MRMRHAKDQEGNPAYQDPVPGSGGLGVCEESRHSAALPILAPAGGEACGARVPPSRGDRERFRAAARAYAQAERLVPPLSLETLARHAGQVCAAHGVPAQYRDYLTVLLGNAIWEDTLAAIPYHRRLLLLPQCLRDKSTCPASMDDFGLLCLECGRCPIGHILPEAEILGYITLVAEGTRMVTQLLERKMVDAVVGVGCLSSLERLFPSMTAAALPGLALPLLRDGCDKTPVDREWVLETIRLQSDQPSQASLDLDALKIEVDGWFAEPALVPLLQPNATETERVACEWVLSGGKRWRPYLVASVFQAIQGGAKPIPDAVRKLAVAVECFHKASLAHDDIEDDDDHRYGGPALHRRHGIPVALNAGDLLVGEGYRLIAESGASPAVAIRMLSVASRGHRDLCLGQGEELLLTAGRNPVHLAKVLEIFRQKTAPAFEVALVLGALCAGADEETCRALHSFSTALGVAYQINDDLEDFCTAGAAGDLQAGRPTIIPALALELAGGEARRELESLFGDDAARRDGDRLRDRILATGAVEEAQKLLEHYRREAFGSIENLGNSILKRFLFQVVFKMLGRAEVHRTFDAGENGSGKEVPFHPEERAEYNYVQ